MFNLRDYFKYKNICIIKKKVMFKYNLGNLHATFSITLGLILLSALLQKDIKMQKKILVIILNMFIAQYIQNNYIYMNKNTKKYFKWQFNSVQHGHKELAACSSAKAGKITS